MFFISTFSAVMSLQDVLEAFIDYDGPGGAREFYHSQNRGWKHWVVAVEDAAQVIISDGFLIYRCYILYDMKWRAIVLPGSIWVAMSVVATFTACRKAVLLKGSSLDDPSMRPLLTATLLLTLATSSMTTYLIIRRLISIQSRPELRGDIQPHFLSRVAKLFFEFGLLYTLSIIASLGVYITGSELEYVAAGAMIHIVEDLGEYHRRFLTIVLNLMQYKKLTAREADWEYMKGIPSVLRANIELWLKTHAWDEAFHV
ncbi:hypothetical protein C8J57DRAFT_1721775 [Mycena rebaudengoi]|nr:hypothetical protein C8J57DRAFT_1721775 [Mycena rebaudengoi]